MHASTATLQTAHASKYLQQLCKHFGHKIPAEFDETTGRNAFAIGLCRLAANDAALECRCEAPSEAQLQQLQTVMKITPSASGFARSWRLRGALQRTDTDFGWLIA